MEHSLPSGRDFVSRILMYTGAYVLAACAVISLYLSGLLQLSSTQWRDFFAIVAVVLVLIFPAMIATHWRVFQQIRACLDALARGEAGGLALRDGFSVIADFPRYWYTWGLGWWAIGGTTVGVGMWLLHPELGLLAPAIVVTATVSAALITDTYYYLTIKEFLEPARTALAAEIGDANVREKLTRPVSLRAKLLTATTSVILVTVIFAALLAQVSIERALASHGIATAQRALDSLGEPERINHRFDFAELDERLSTLGDSYVAVQLAPESGDVVAGDPTLLSKSDRAWIAALDVEIGTSEPRGTGRAFAWRRLPGDFGALVVAVPPAHLQADSGARGAFAGLLCFSTLVAIGVSYLIARDVGRATTRLREEAARITRGDLTPGAPLESEDDMGALARSFERMTVALRTTVGRVASAADRMQSAATGIASTSRNVADANAAQVEGITRATRSMGEIDRKVGDIAGSAEQLCSDVESASSAIVQLEDAGVGLESNAVSLSSNVDDVASSIEELATSIGQVANSSDAVAEAAEGASRSMMETSAAVHQVSESTTMMSGLATRVVELSEQGSERVRDTVAAMRAIREATDAAQQVMRELGESAGRIGSVLSVIDNVAEETHLLALNAAIIAAQAGERGKSFAVVAAEVKSLARRVRSSTAEITELIRTLQQQSDDASWTIERGAALVNEGVEQSGEAGSSLDAITQAARETGLRVEEIVAAMGEQSKAVTLVSEMMLRVREGTEQIRHALQEQGHNTALLRQSSAEVGDVSKQVQHTTGEQRQSTASIGGSVRNIRDAVDLIKRALHDQTQACRSAVEFVEGVNTSTASNEDSVRELEGSIRSLQEKADELHAEVARFRT